MHAMQTKPPPEARFSQRHGLWKAVLFDRVFMKDVIYRWKGAGLIYLHLVVAIIWIPLTAQAEWKLHSFVEDEAATWEERVTAVCARKRPSECFRVMADARAFDLEALARRDVRREQHCNARAVASRERPAARAPGRHRAAGGDRANAAVRRHQALDSKQRPGLLLY